jgi:hypothetical protein
MAERAGLVITADEMARLSPQQRADAIEKAALRSWEEVPEPFKTEVFETAAVLGAQRCERANRQFAYQATLRSDRHSLETASNRSMYTVTNL